MYEFLRKLFSVTTSGRVEDAGDRIAKAAEQMASDWEEAAAKMREQCVGPADVLALPAADGTEAVVRRRPARKGSR